LQPAVDQIAWQKALALLADIDNRQLISRLRAPALFLFGEQDALVPVAAAEQTRQLQGGDNATRVEVLPDVGHAPHLSRPQLVAERIEQFLRADPYLLKKSQVAAAFGKAASTYDSAARLQRQTGERLLERLDEQGLQPHRIADLGCGTGLFTGMLRHRYPGAACIGLDLAEGMLHYCQARSSERGTTSAKQAGCTWLCGDAEQLPFADRSLDLVFSNFTFQWCQQPDSLFAEIDRVLRPGGVLAFSTIGPGSLRELRAA